MHLLDGVVVKLMRCFALALELPEDHFTKAMSPDDDDNGTALFFNRYPSVEGRTFPAGAVRDARVMPAAMRPSDLALRCSCAYTSTPTLRCAAPAPSAALRSVASLTRHRAVRPRR